MGRLIDIDVLFDYFGNDAIDETVRSNIEYFISEKGTVEAIPKAEYETRLRADMVAMLTDIQLEIEEIDSRAGYDGNGMPTFANDYVRIMKVNEIIQQKIDALKGN